MIVYGVDPGIRNLAITKLSTYDDTFEIMWSKKIDLGTGRLRFHAFHKFFNRYMLEEGTVRIEFQHRAGKSRDVSFYVLAYLRAMFSVEKVELVQPRTKFDLFDKLGILPDHDDLKVYENRKNLAIDIMKIVDAKVNFDRKIKPNQKLDDLADSLIYALIAARDRCPNCLSCLSNKASSLEAKPERKVESINLSA